MLTGLVAGTVNLTLALAQGAVLPSIGIVLAAGVVGFLGYGVSLALFVLGLRSLGTARTGAYFSLAPFIGALLSLALLSEPLTLRLIVAGGLMAVGLWLHLTERHEHEHLHEMMEHGHRHTHDEHHQHSHGPDDPPGEPHSHWLGTNRWCIRIRIIPTCIIGMATSTPTKTVLQTSPVGPDRRAASLALRAARARDRQLGSYGAAKRKIMPGVEHRQSRYLNNRAEVSHQPTRRRERQMQRFKSARHAQRFLSAHSRIHNHFQLRRHRLSAIEYRAARGRAFSTWREVVGVAAAI